MRFTDCLHIHWDIETYSEIDLTKVGVYKYADHPSTDVLMGSYQISDSSRVHRWRPGQRYPFEQYHDRLGDDVFIVAWNSQFERILWWRTLAEKHGWPAPPLEAFVCAAAWARSTASSPGKLELAGMFFGQTAQKDMRGHQLMLKMCRPATDAQQAKWLNSEDANIYRHAQDTREQLAERAKRCHHTPEQLDREHDYCDDDVRTEKQITDILPEFEWPEISAFWESERINDRGLVVDVDFAEAAAEYAEQEKQELLEELVQITGDEGMTPRTFARFKDWALPRMSEDAIKITEYYDKGVKKNTFDANARNNLLAAAADDPDFLNQDVFEAIQILDEAGKSTISKYQNIARRACTWGTDARPRVHGAYMYAGAAQTNRYSSTGIQMHNLVRTVPPDAATIRDAFITRDPRRVKQVCAMWADLKNEKRKEGQKKVPASPIHVLGEMVRPTITGDPEDTFDLVWGDWSSIEAVVLPWLSLEPSAEDTLSRFRLGEDIYIPDASSILKKPSGQITKFERQCYGKVPRLALGFCGGEGALTAMAKNYGVFFEGREKTRIVKGWRKANPWAQCFGTAVEKAARRAMQHPARGYSAGRLEYMFEEDALGGLGALFCVLPSGRRICYPEPRLEIVKTPWGEQKQAITCRKGSWRPKKDATDWPRVTLSRCTLLENPTQAACADLLNIALQRARGDGLIVCGHTHDEIILEAAHPEDTAKELQRIMETKPGWPGDDALPIRAEVEFGYRYKVPFKD